MIDKKSPAQDFITRTLFPSLKLLSCNYLLSRCRHIPKDPTNALMECNLSSHLLQNTPYITAPISIKVLVF